MDAARVADRGPSRRYRYGEKARSLGPRPRREQRHGWQRREIAVYQLFHRPKPIAIPGTPHKAVGLPQPSADPLCAVALAHQLRLAGLACMPGWPDSHDVIASGELSLASREQRSCRCYSPAAGAAASANGLPSESRHTAQRSPGWMIEPPSSRTRSSVVARSATVK